MDWILQEEIDKFMHVYLDDISIFSRTFEEHLAHLDIVFRRLREADLRLNPEKCTFVRKRLEFLGHMVSEDGLSPDPAKVDKVQNFPVPTTVKTLRGFLGLASYYRRFIQGFSQHAAPLYQLLRKNVVFSWQEPQQQAFQYLKNKLTSAPVLACPDFDREFIVHTDASTVGLGAVLSQKDERGLEHAVAYASRSLNKAERNYTTTEQECLAVVWAVKQFRVYLHGKGFEVVTDHAALKWLLNHCTPRGRLTRWIVQL